MNGIGNAGAIALLTPVSTMLGWGVCFFSFLMNSRLKNNLAECQQVAPLVEPGWEWADGRGSCEYCTSFGGTSKPVTGCAVIFYGLVDSYSHSSLKELDLSGNDLGSEAGQSIARAVGTNKKILVLDSRLCKFSPVCANARCLFLVPGY
jgi:hypothetical protein